jgi:sporulation protein YlmC with PRC-barrel domain
MRMYTLILASSLALGASSLAGRAQTSVAVAPGAFILEQPENQWLAHVFLGAAVQNTAGETIGKIADLVFTPAGQISTAVLGVGGFLGMGEKHVAVPYSALSFKAGTDGARIIVVAVTKETLTAVPAFRATEKTTYDMVKDKAMDLGQKSVDKAVEIKDSAAKKIDDMTKSAPANK